MYINEDNKDMITQELKTRSIINGQVDLIDIKPSRTTHVCFRNATAMFDWLDVQFHNGT